MYERVTDQPALFAAWAITVYYHDGKRPDIDLEMHRYPPLFSPDNDRTAGSAQLPSSLEASLLLVLFLSSPYSLRHQSSGRK